MKTTQCIHKNDTQTLQSIFYVPKIRFFSKAICSIILLSSFLLQGQQNNDIFTFYGVKPQVVSQQLHQDLKNATEITKKITILETIAAIHIQAGNTDSIIYYGNLLKSDIVQQKEKIKNSTSHLSKAHHILGEGKLKKGLFDEALKEYLEGITISPALGMSKMHYSHQLGLGIVYVRKKEYDKALPILERCIAESQDVIIKTKARKHIGDLYFLKNDFENAKTNYLQVLKVLESDSINKTFLKTQLNLGQIEIRENNLKDALPYFETVKRLAKKNNFHDLYIEASLQIGIAYYYLKKYEAAEMVLSSAYVNSVQWNRLELQRDIINILKYVYVAKEDYKNAYNLMSQYVDISNQIITAQNKEVIKELEIKYQTLQKEKEIFLLKEKQLQKESEIKRQTTIKNAFLIGFLIILVPVIGLLILYFQKLKTQIALNTSQEEVNQQKVSGLIKDQELKLIKASIEGQDKERQRLARELHDSVGGNLASIKLQFSNADKKDTFYTNIVKQLDDTYHQVRDFSHNLIPKKFQHNAITSLIKEYITNVKTGNDQNIAFHPYPEEKIDKINTTLKEELFKIIQELLTNCLKHAKAEHIDIYLNHHGDSLQLLFEDDGVGFDSNKIIEGIGIKNIKKRLDMLSGSIHIDSMINRGTVIDIVIPVKSAVIQNTTALL